jgi:Eco57I restriction-modification methylase
MRAEAFPTVRSVGGLLPADILTAIAGGDDLPGMRPSDFGLPDGETVREAANRSWDRLRAAWLAFRRAAPAGAATEPLTEPTRAKWLRVLFEELGYGRLPAVPAGGLRIDGVAYPLSHQWQRTPIHLLGAGVPLDRRTANVPGAARQAPHSLLQELLNRSEDHLWGLVSNGLTLRLLRDSATLVRQAYVEFDLEGMFDGEVFADFALLWQVCHASRVEPQPDPSAPASTCWLERWREEGATRGTRALTTLRLGVTDALRVFGRGFLAATPAVREALRDGTLRPRGYHRLLLRVVYQLLVLFVAEDRGLLHHPGAGSEERRRYTAHFSTARLRRRALGRQTADRHTDLWTALRLVTDGLGNANGLPALGLPGLGGVYQAGTLGALEGAALANRDLLAAVRALAVTRDDSGVLRPVDYRNLGAEELGSVYESLLELVPSYDPATGRYDLTVQAGSDRKTSGSYYTPSGLVEVLLDTTLDPVLDQAERADDPEAALLAVTVCDPACGSGHFLAAAGRRIARRLAARRTGEAEPPVEALATAMRDVVSHCLYGVDLNPLAAELAKVALWLEALEPGRPLSFLDAHIKVGNALLGTTPELVAGGLPDAAFTPLTDDDRKTVAALKKRNKAERGGQDILAFGEEPVSFAAAFREIADAPEQTLADVQAKAAAWRAAEESAELARAKLAADSWCAAFVWPRRPDAAPGLTSAYVRRLADDGRALSEDQRAEVGRLGERYGLFHWPLEFPDVLPGGFSCVLGNPPWERLKLQEEEFFAGRAPEIADAGNAAIRKRLIAGLEEQRPALWQEYRAALRDADAASLLARRSGRYPLTGSGDINTYALFAETDLSLVAPEGRLGVVLPTAIATGDTTAPFFRRLVETSTLAAFLDFENEAKIFPAVTNKFRFALLVATGGRRVESARFAFSTRYISQLAEREFALRPSEILLVNPNSGTSPVFRSRQDAEITLRIHRRVPVLWHEDAAGGNPWRLSFLRMFDMATDSHRFRTEKSLRDGGWSPDGNVFVRGSERMLPLYEAKLVYHFDHRYATYAGATREQVNKGTLPKLGLEQHDESGCLPWPRYWVAERDVNDALVDRWERGWLLGWRDIAPSVNERTMIAATIPRTAVGDKFLLALPGSEPHACLQANLSALVLDYCTRQKHAGTSIKYHLVRQLPILPPSAYDHPAPWQIDRELREWVTDRVLELSYTAWDLEPYARDLGDDGPPFRWDEGRRAQLRAELDAAYLHLYGLTRDEAEHVIDSFFVLRKIEERTCGEFRSRRLVLAAYDAMATGSFTSPLDPPPGHGPRHPNRS